DSGPEKLAAVVIHTGRPPIARWSVAHPKGKKPKEPTTFEVTSGWIALMDAGAGSPGVIATPTAEGIQPIEVPLADGSRAGAAADYGRVARLSNRPAERLDRGLGIGLEARVRVVLVEAEHAA